MPHTDLTIQELKPCPFCGSDAETKEDGDIAWIQCTNSKCVTRPEWIEVDEQDAIKLWNTRANPSEYPNE